jgi:hypothetical protein
MECSMLQFQPRPLPDYNYNEQSKQESAAATTTLAPIFNLEYLLNKINPLSEVTKVRMSDDSVSYTIQDGTKVSYVINYETPININQSEIASFETKCKEGNMNGIMLSQKSGIVGKKTFDIVFNNQLIFIYLCQCSIDENVIQLAYMLIDKMQEQMKYFNTVDNYIGQENLNQIKNEYQDFLQNKEQLLKNIKYVQTNIFRQLESIQFPQLDYYLCMKSMQPKKICLIKCDLCNFYTSNTLKGMAAHKRGCKKKMQLFATPIS